MENEDSLLTGIGDFSDKNQINDILDQAALIQARAAERNKPLPFKRDQILSVWADMTRIPNYPLGHDAMRTVDPTVVLKVALPSEGITWEYGLREAMTRAFVNWQNIACNN